MRSLRMEDRQRRVQFHNQLSKVDWYRGCSRQAPIPGNPRIDFIHPLESDLFETHSPRVSFFKKKEKWLLTIEIAAIHQSRKWQKHPLVNMGVSQPCLKRKIQCIKVIMWSHRHLPQQPMHQPLWNIRNLMLQQRQVIHLMCSSNLRENSHKLSSRSLTRKSW